MTNVCVLESSNKNGKIRLTKIHKFEKCHFLFNDALHFVAIQAERLITHKHCETKIRNN